MKRRKIAIVGSGISGLSAAWLLNRSHDVTVFEKADYVGGHSNTVDIVCEGKSIAVDTGFIVFNPQNYPNLTALFDILGVETVSTDMSFAVSRGAGAFEYSGGDNAGMLAQPSNVIRPHFWRMISGILRFYRHADAYDLLTREQDLTLGELLDREGYSRAFIEDHLAPMGAAIWSTDSVDILEYPAASFLAFFRNHGLMQLSGRPQWRTVVGGSREYVKKMSTPFADRIFLNEPVTGIRRLADGVRVSTKNNGTEKYDDVVLACHSDQALDLLDDASNFERDTLSKMRYGKNTAVLHTDPVWLPKRKKAWASWNYMEAPGIDETERENPAITYWMNRLQHLPVNTPVMVTLNPYADVAKEHVLASFDYEHPIFDRAALQARNELMKIQGQGRTWFCGAYLGDGFHEDGIQAGLAVAEMLGREARPWSRPGQNARVGLPEQIIKAAS